MSWTAPKPFPHYIVLDLGAPHKALQFRYVCRNGGGRDNPKAIDVLVSDAFTESAATYANETGTRKLASFTNLPNTLHATYETNRTIKSETPFRYVWFKINGSTSNQQWVALVLSKKVCKLTIILIFALSNKKQQEYGTYTRTNFGNYFELHK